MLAEVPSLKDFWRALGGTDPGDEENLAGCGYEAVRNYHYDREAPLSYLQRVAEVFPGINPEWLFLGEGPITRAQAASVRQPPAATEETTTVTIYDQVTADILGVSVGQRISDPGLVKKYMDSIPFIEDRWKEHRRRVREALAAPMPELLSVLNEIGEVHPAMQALRAARFALTGALRLRMKSEGDDSILDEAKIEGMVAEAVAAPVRAIQSDAGAWSEETRTLYLTLSLTLVSIAAHADTVVSWDAMGKNVHGTETAEG